MPRPRYPSDDDHNERRSPAFFKAHTSIQNHPRMVAVYADNDLLAAWLRLGILCRDRGAAETDDRIHLSKADAERVSAKRRADVAATLLQRLADSLGWSTERRGDVLVIHFRNFARKQGITPRKTRNTPPSERSDSAETPLSPSPSPSLPVENMRSRAESVGASRPTKAPDGLVFDSGLELLRERSGMSEDAARRFLGGLCAGGRKPAVLRAIGEAVAENALEPRSFIAARVNGSKRSGEGSPAAQASIDWSAEGRKADAYSR